ncbi:hypothetical protein Pint_25656 [Pistacia integerrima]|uniref:Uncharacterized protein n=1 Tax=Pistacia integerrima TaxID=434235 RepID=A0ACC0YEV5_9ROSI|nr:hypothetical protein Pint_25656 [Pistacia integerrima]
MIVGELLLSAFLSVLFDRLASRELLDLAWQDGLGSNPKKVEETLKLIDKVLSDAERQHLDNRAVEFWLNNLRDLAYDMEDILDEFSYEALRRRLGPIYVQTLTSKVRNVIPVYFTSLKFNVRMKSKIKGVISRLEKLYRQSIELGLEINSEGKPISDSALRSRRESRGVNEPSFWLIELGLFTTVSSSSLASLKIET